MLIEKKGTRYNIEVIAQSNEVGAVRTSFWISIYGYIVKYKVTDEFRIIQDKELEEFIEQNIDSWIEDYDIFTSRFN